MAGCWRAGATPASGSRIRPRMPRWLQSATASPSMAQKTCGGATIYTSGEPCPMCMGAIAYCRIARVVYGASIEELSKVLGQIKVSSTEIAAKTTFTAIEVTGGVLAEDALKLFDAPVI